MTRRFLLRLIRKAGISVRGGGRLLAARRAFLRAQPASAESAARIAKALTRALRRALRSGKAGGAFDREAARMASEELERVDRDGTSALERRIRRSVEADRRRNAGKASGEGAAILMVKGRVEGISVREILSEPAVRRQYERLRSEAMERLSAFMDDVTIDAMEEMESLLKSGVGGEEALRRVAESSGRSLSWVSRNTVIPFASRLNSAKLIEAGVKEAIWLARPDRLTRPMHRAFNKQRYPIKKGLYDPERGIYVRPGEDYNCRCNFMGVIE